MPDIKTRDTVKGTVKTLDRAAVAGERMKETYIRTRDKAEHSVSSAENSPEEYAADRFSGGTETVTYEAAHQLDKQGRKGVQATRENISKAKEHFEQRKVGSEQPSTGPEQRGADIKQRKADLPKQQAREKVAENVRRRSANTAGQSVKNAGREVQAIKTVERGEKTIKQSARSTGKATVKTTKRTIKTADQTARTAIKTSQAAAKAAQKTAQATAKASRRAAQAARETARATVIGVKAAAKATAAAVKAIIAGTKALIAAIAAGGWVAVVIILVVVLLGCAVALFGGGTENSSYTPVSAEVEAYDPLIRQYAAQYGVSEYVELIKAVMMQESGGRGLDPMQAAEGSFNTLYPHEPNGIQDPEYSIQCGVQELKAALISAEVENAIDMDRIKLALQGYNFGNGYISWALSNYGGYSYANAVEFSTMQAERLGWERYGDTQYPAHVLRYYPYGRAFTAGGNQAIVEVALTQLGNEGGQPYWSWYGFDSRVEWCACFVSWCADQCGYIDSGIVPKFSGCVNGVSWFQNNGQWQGRDYEPQPGDIIFFDWDNKGSSGPQDGSADHVGIVEKVENGVIYTVEGNSSDSCREKTYTVGYYEVLGFGCPAY